MYVSESFCNVVTGTDTFSLVPSGYCTTTTTLCVPTSLPSGIVSTDSIVFLSLVVSPVKFGIVTAFVISCSLGFLPNGLVIPCAVGVYISSSVSVISTGTVRFAFEPSGYVTTTSTGNVPVVFVCGTFTPCASSTFVL